MGSSRLYNENTRLLTADAFAFVLALELKRAARSQDFLTLLTIRADREWEGVLVAAEKGVLLEVASLITSQIRTTDLMSQTDEGTLALVLLGADDDQSARVIGRIAERIKNHRFATSLHIVVGAASCPQHAVDAETLKKQAVARSVMSWRGALADDTKPQ